MKKIGILILNYAQIIGAFFLMQYLKVMDLDITDLNDLGLILASTAFVSIIAGFLNRISDDWAGFSVVAIMIYALIVTLKSKYLLVGLPASMGLVVMFYLPSGMNMERLKNNREKALSEENKEILPEPEPDKNSNKSKKKNKKK